TLNGVALQTSWIRHNQIANGGTLILTMGPAPSTWGTTNPPPSLSDTVSSFCPAVQAQRP
ncbi:MAG TPA: hypothetical protein VGM27_05185, partial [Acidobacteriaceae bacterium]